MHRDHICVFEGAIHVSGMGGTMMYTRITTLIMLLLLAGTVPLAAGEKNPHPTKSSVGTEDEQAACAPDAKKFCVDKIPDTFAVLACLQAHRQRLSKACRHVLEENGQ
jgi:hypothetical protein